MIERNHLPRGSPTELRLSSEKAPSAMHFATRLRHAIRQKRTPALVGLDPRFDWLPAEIHDKVAGITDPLERVATAFEEFCQRIIDVVAPLVPAVKPQAAFFEQYGPPGVAALANVIRYARKAGLLVICDAKRGDIGTTATAYAEAYLAGADASRAPFAADALTVSPYLGRDTLEPFVSVANERGAGIYVLVRTSNPGAATFQDLATEGRSVFERVAGVVEALAIDTADETGTGCVGAVVGATYPNELTELRSQLAHAPLLIPGYGSQGGSAADVAGGFFEDGWGALVNNSRGINFAYRTGPFAEQFGPAEWEQAIQRATEAMISDLATHTAAGKLA